MSLPGHRKRPFVIDFHAHIVMGSDYPVGEADPVGFVMKARGLTSEDQADILGRNAAKLLGLVL